MKGELILLSQCKLRPLVPADAPGLSRHGNNRNVWAHTVGLPYPFPVDLCRKWIREKLENKSRNFLTIEIEGEAAGCIVLSFHPEPKSHSADVGYWLGETYWNRGIMTEGLAAITMYGFVHHNLARIQAFVLGDNKASMRVLEKCGYVREGTLRKSIEKEGRLYDQAVYGCLADNA